MQRKKVSISGRIYGTNIICNDNMMVSSSTNPPPPPPIRPQRVRSRSRSSNHRNSNSCNDLQQQQQRIIDNSSPPSQMLSSRISPTNISSSSSSGKRRWRNPFARSNSVGNSPSPSPIYNRPTLSQSHSRPNNSRGRTQGRSSTAPGYISQGMPSLPFSQDINQGSSRSGSASTSHSTRNEKVNTSCAQQNNRSRSSSRGRLQRPISDRRLAANRTTKHSRSPPPLLERRAVYQPVCNSEYQRRSICREVIAGNIAKKSTQHTQNNVQHSQPHNNNLVGQQNHDRRSYDLNSDLVNSIREIYHIIPAPPPQQINDKSKNSGISPQNNNSAVSNGSKSPNNSRTVLSIRSQPPPPPPPIRNQPQKQQAPPPPPRVSNNSNNSLSEFVMYTPEEFERIASVATDGQQLLKYPPPPPPKQPQQQQQKGIEEGYRKTARRRRSRSNEFGLSSSLVKRLSKEEEGNVNTSSQLLDISESTREGLPFDIIPTATKQEEGPSSRQTYRRTKSQDNVISTSHIIGQGQNSEYNKSNMTFNLSEFRDVLDQMKRKDNDPQAVEKQEGKGERRMSFMTKTRRQLSHAQEVIALVANPTVSSSSNASKSTARSGSKSADQNDIEHHHQQQQEEEEKQHLGYRHDYNLGDTARSSSHMIIETDAQRAIESIGTLSSHDFAFVKRSDGSYTYSILAYRSSSTHVDEESLITRPPQLQGEEVEESMTFVLSNAGCTKLIRKSQWNQCIRLVASEEEEDGTAQSLPVTVLQPDKTAAAAKEAEDEEVREVQSNPDVEIYLKKIRDQSYNTTQEEKKQPLQPGDPGWTPPDTLAFNTNMDDDLISCISTPMGLTREADDGQDKKITISTQPVIEE